MGMEERILIVDDVMDWKMSIKGKPVIFAIDIHSDYSAYYPWEFLSEMENRSWDEYSVMIVGNNVGKGLDIVENIPDTLRSRVIVAAGEPLDSSSQARYQELGVRNFYTRTQIRQVFEENRSISALLSAAS